MADHTEKQDLLKDFAEKYHRFMNDTDRKNKPDGWIESSKVGKGVIDEDGNVEYEIEYSFKTR